MTWQRQTNGESGYTLIELLVAMTLVGFLSAGLLTSIGTASRVWEGSESRSLTLSETAILETTVRQHLEQSVPGVVARDGRAREGVFQGSSTKITFLTSTEAGTSGSGIFVEEMEIRRRDRVFELVFRRTRSPLRIINASKPLIRDEAVIPIGGVEAKFRFYGAPGVGRSDSWHSEWRDAPMQPALIGLFFLGGEDEETPRDIIVAPRRQVPGLIIGQAELNQYIAAREN